MIKHEFCWYWAIFKFPGEDVWSDSFGFATTRSEATVTVILEVACPLPTLRIHVGHDRAISIYLLPEAISRIALVVLVGHQTIIAER